MTSPTDHVVADEAPDEAPDEAKPYVDTSRRPRSFYVVFIVLEFWLGVIGLSLLIVGPWIAGAVILALAALIFVAGLVLG